MTKTTMNAMAVHEFGTPDQLVPTRVEIREPAAGEVLIRVKAAAVNPADVGMREGRYSWPEPLRMPLIPGYDVAGVVETGTERFPAGTAVIGYTAHTQTQIGAYAEYVTLPERLVAAAPSAEVVDWATAAALPLAGLTAQTALRELGVVAEETLLDNRVSSAVGRLVAQLAVAAGVEVVTPRGGSAGGGSAGVGAEGAAPVVAGVRFVEPLESSASLGVGAVVDAALDVVGGDTALAAFARVKDGGRYATVVPEFWIPGGQFTTARGIDPVTVFVDENAGSLAELSRLAEAGTIRPVVAEQFALTAAADAHRRLAAGGGRGKLILVP